MYDIFISYRRDGGHEMARLLYEHLKLRGLDVFFDLEELGSGQFNTKLLDSIDASKNFVLILSPNALERCQNEGDWVRQEIEHAIQEKKNIVPLMMNGFSWPNDLPESITTLPFFNGVSLIREYFDASLTKLISLLELDPEKKEKVKRGPAAQGVSDAVTPLLKRAFMFVEDGDWKSANEYCEKVLDKDPENVKAYLGKLLAEQQVRKQEQLKDCALPFDKSNNYLKVLRFGDDKLRKELTDDIKHINARNAEQARLEGIYQEGRKLMAKGDEASYFCAAVKFSSISHYKDSQKLIAECKESARLEGNYNRAISTMTLAKSADQYQEAADLFFDIRAYKNSNELAVKCSKTAEILRNEAIYSEAIKAMTSNDVEVCRDALSKLESLSAWRNVKKQISTCREKIQKLEAEIKERERQEKLAKAKKKRAKITLIVVAALICALAILVLILKFVVIPNNKYNDAVALMKDGNLNEAYALFEELGDYKDSAELMHKIDRMKAMKDIQVGDTVKLGRYEQDNDAVNAWEEIAWTVLDVRDGNALIVSKYALDRQAYNDTYTGVTWETCQLRQWLNNEFFNKAFTAADKARIVETSIPVDPNPSYQTDPGAETKDKVFVLSLSEIQQYLFEEGAKECKLTASALAHGAAEDSASGNGSWWTRTPGYNQDFTVIIDSSGTENNLGTNVNDAKIAVRPAMWIRLNG